MKGGSPRPKISVVVPIYGVEKYIEQCALSLFGQTLQDIEYIFIDDCSPDDSIRTLRSVLEDYPDRKPMCKFIRHEKNMGVGRSRQDGIDSAKGEYIIHCDPDDWIEPDMYETLFRTAARENADMVFCDYWTHEGTRSTYRSQYTGELKSKSLLATLCGATRNSQNGLWALWNKLVRRECYRGTRFREDSFMWEDTLMLMQMLRRDLRINRIPKAFYHYRIDVSKSFTHRSIDSEVLSNDLKLFDMLHEILYSPIDFRLRKCYGAAVTQIVWRSFATSRCLFSNAEWSSRYGEYAPLAKFSAMRRMNKVMIRLSGMGFYTCCYRSYRFMRQMLK